MREEGAVGGEMGASRDGTGHVAEGVVTGTQVAGAWSGGSGREDGRSVLTHLSGDRPRPQSPATPTTSTTYSSQRNLSKKSLRSNTKK